MADRRVGSSSTESRADQLGINEDSQHARDAARFLATSLMDSENERMKVFARIRGIERLRVVRAWRAVERKIGAQDLIDHAPRDRILDALDEREQYLEEHGERPDYAAGDDVDPDDVPDRYWPRPSPDPDEIDKGEATWPDKPDGTRTPAPSLPSITPIDDDQDRDLAADGGDPDGK